jgi:hypothetical protein
LAIAACLLAVLGLAAGCTRVVVKKDPGPHDRGFRFNRPKPYLYIGPISSPPSSSSPSGANASKPNPSTGGTAGPGGSTSGGASGGSGSGGGSGGQTLSDSNFIKVSMEIKYLPDYNEEYSLKLKPGLGIGNLSFTLQDGWNLTSVNMMTNQELPELINSVASLVSSIRGGAAGGAGAASGAKKVTGPGGPDDQIDSMNIIVDTRPDVPLGFYEPIIATDPHGRKSLFGWRYVGFLPFTGCPVAPCVQPSVVTCDPSELWGIVATPNSIKFDRLCDMPSRYTPGGNWPYKYKEVPRMDTKGADGRDSPPPTSVPPKPDDGEQGTSNKAPGDPTTLQPDGPGGAPPTRLPPIPPR